MCVRSSLFAGAIDIPVQHTACVSAYVGGGGAQPMAMFWETERFLSHRDYKPMPYGVKYVFD